MDICVITNDAVLARFIALELAEVGYDICSGENATDARLYICDLDFTEDIPEGAIGFSYNEAKRGAVQSFLPRPIDAAKLRSAVSKRLSEPASAKDTVIEASRTTRKLRTDKGEVRLSEKEFALLEILCKSSVLAREDGAALFGNGESNVVDVYMHYLRKKLAKVYDGETVKSKRGKGYTLPETLKINFT